MGRPSDWVREVTGRAPMRSPGAPGHPRSKERDFWEQISTGKLPREAADVVGVAQAVGQRWFRHAGGMTPYSWPAPAGRYLSLAEREEIAILHATGHGVRAIASAIGRSPSTISRELRRNAATRGGKLEYRASVAHWKAELFARRPKTAKLTANDRLRHYVEDRLSGRITMPGGDAVAGPLERQWKGLNKPHRQDRRWVKAWSPEQISNRLPIDFPDDLSMRISHEAIYQSLFIEGRGALRRELILCLRTGRALRMPRARAKRAAWAHVSPDVLISERPEEADDRAIPGHHEGDLIIACGQVRNRNRRRAHNRIHHPRAPATGAWVATATDHQERAGTVGIRSGVDEQSVGTGTGVDAHRTQTLADLGPRERDVRTRPVHHRHRSEGLLRRPTQPVATRHQQEHEWTTAPILSEGN